MATSSPTKLDRPLSAAASTARISAEPPVCGRREGGGADRQHLLGVGGAHGLDRVAGVDRALEGVRALDGHHVGDLHHVEEGCDAGGDVLAEGGGGEDDGVVVARERDDEVGDRLGKAVGDGVAVRRQHGLDAGEGGRFLRGAVDVAACHEDVDRRAKGVGGGECLVRGVTERAAGMVGDE